MAIGRLTVRDGRPYQEISASSIIRCELFELSVEILHPIRPMTPPKPLPKTGIQNLSRPNPHLSYRNKNPKPFPPQLLSFCRNSNPEDFLPKPSLSRHYGKPEESFSPPTVILAAAGIQSPFCDSTT